MDVRTSTNRTHVTLALSSADSETLPAVGKLRVTLKPGDNARIPIGYWHAVGADPATARLIAAGTIAAVCREHVFDDGPGGKYQDADDEHTPCECCGHNKASAKAAALVEQKPVAEPRP